MVEQEPEQLEADMSDEAQEIAALKAEANMQIRRMIEALLFASARPLGLDEIRQRLPDSADVKGMIKELQADYRNRGVNLVYVDGKYLFRTAPDLSFLLQGESEEPRKLSRAALETLAIIAYHQPVTRAEIEAIRGVGTSKGTLDVLLQTEWVRLRGRRRTPGRPVTYGTSEHFLVHFGLESIQDLPGLEELRGAGMLDSALPPAFSMPIPNDDEDLTPDEDPLEEEDLVALALEEDQDNQLQAEPDSDKTSAT